ncbi:hypothetical protein PHMEG_00038711, partial [Phytophthora megakarya]
RGDVMDFPDLVMLVHSLIAPMLRPQDACYLLMSCSRLLKQDIRDRVATQALLHYYTKNGAHFGLKCPGDWHQLIPQSVQAARGRCACNWDSKNSIEIIPSELPLPRMFDARAHILEAVCLVYRGIEPHCFKVLQMFRGGGYFEAATMQPIVFSLTEGLEKEHAHDMTKAAPINVDDTKELERLLNIAEPGFGLEFFSSRNLRRSPAHILEAHWRGISVNQSTGVTTCQFCESYSHSALFHKVRGIPTEQNDGQLRAHCSAVYQPLKKFMMQHLKHVRYVRPPRGWNYEPNGEYELLDLIAGFTPAGVLCGVYVTDIGIPSSWVRSRLAAGYYEFPRADPV